MKQAGLAIRMMPELLALHYEDSRKPTQLYLFQEMKLRFPQDQIAKVSTIAKDLLEGSDSADLYLLVYLLSLGVSWQSIRVLCSALPGRCGCGLRSAKQFTNFRMSKPATSTVGSLSCALEPSWDLIQQKRTIRKKLKQSSNDYLRQRLQVRPADVHKMMRTHSRLSTASSNLLRYVSSFYFV